MAFRLTAADKKVIDAFTDKKRADSKKLKTDGKSLRILGFGGGVCCFWKGGKISCPDPDSRAMQSVQRAVKKNAPANWMESALDDETREQLEALAEAKDPAKIRRTMMSQMMKIRDDHYKVVRVYPEKGDADGPFPRSLLRLIKKGGGAVMVELQPGKEGKLHPKHKDTIMYPDSSRPRYYFLALDSSGKRDGYPVALKPAQYKRAMSYHYESEESTMGEVFTEEQRSELTQLAERMSDEARELKLYVDNDGQLYRQQTTSIIKNLMRKRAAGQYDSKKAVKLVMYLMDNGAKKYAKEHGSPGVKWNDMFPKRDRMMAAEDWVEDFESEADEGSYDEYIPKKYRKK